MVTKEVVQNDLEDIFDHHPDIGNWQDPIEKIILNTFAVSDNVHADDRVVLNINYM